MFGISARATKETMATLRAMKAAETKAKRQQRSRQRRIRYEQITERAQMMLTAGQTGRR